MIFITGKFDLEQGHPYFASLAVDQAKLTYVGNIPEHITFELKVKGAEGVNYIVLPLDTTIKKASQICNDPELGMRGTDTIGVWDVENQEISNPVTGGGPLECRFIRIGQDFDVYPGQVYRIWIPSDKTWNQK